MALSVLCFLKKLLVIVVIVAFREVPAHYGCRAAYSRYGPTKVLYVMSLCTLRPKTLDSANGSQVSDQLLIVRQSFEKKCHRGFGR